MGQRLITATETSDVGLNGLDAGAVFANPGCPGPAQAFLGVRNMTTTFVGLPTCRWCGTYHPHCPCPHVNAIEYHPDGSVKRVEFVRFVGQVRIYDQRCNTSDFAELPPEERGAAG